MATTALLEHLHFIVEATRDAIVSANQRGVITFCNSAAERMFGYAANELIGDSLTVLMPDRFREGHRSGLDRFVATSAGRVMGQTVELVGRRKNGSDFPIELSLSTRDKDGEKVFVGVIRDISARQLAEQQARNAEARYRRIVETTREGILGLDAEGRVTFTNARMEELLGFASGAMHGKHVFELMDEDGRAIATQNLARRRQGLSEGGEFRFKHTDGRDVWLRFESTPLMEDDGSYSGLFAMLMDISDRRHSEDALKRSEAQLQHAQEIAGIGTWDWDLVANQVVRSERLMRMLGWPTSLSSVEGGEFFDVVHADDRERVRAEIERSVRDRVRLETDYRVHCPTGIRFLHVRGDLVLDQGKPVHLIGTVQDVTEKRHVEARLLLADRMASVGTLAAGVAHEINNPLASVTANLEMIAEEIRAMAGGSPSGRMRELETLTAEARQGAERVRKIVRGLKTFSRADTEQRAILDVRQVLDLAANMSFNEIRHRAGLVKDYADVPSVEADEARLGQVFVNLLVNAAHAIPEGLADKNEIRIATKTDPNGRVVIEVHDTGQGIAPAAIGRIFDPFFTTKPIGVGTGLGLSICHSIITALSGEITVESQVGHGTTFRIVLPAASLDDSSRDASPREHRAKGARVGCVLIVDDDVLLAGSMRRVLREHDVTVANSGRDALALLRSGKRFDVIFCDLMMPEMTGMELYAHVGEEMPDQLERFVFVTGGAFTQSAREFLDEVPNDRAEKPFASQSMRALVQRFLR